MSLQVWLPLNGNTKNQGLLGELLTATAPTYTDGKFGKALSSGALRMSAEQTNQTLNNDEISIAFWIYINADDSTSAGLQVFGNGSTGTNNNRKYSLFLYPTVNDLHWYWQNDTSAIAASATLSDILPSYKWTHVAVTYKNPNARIYINGELVKSFSCIMTSSTYAYETNLMPSSSLRWFNDYRVYSHCISAKEVKELAKGLCLHYKLSEQMPTPTVVPENVIENSFDFNDNTWSISTGWIKSIHEDGSTVLSFSRTGATANNWYRAIPNAKFVPNDYPNGITVSFDFMCDDISALNSRILCAVQCYNASGSRIGWYESATTIPTNYVSGTWVRLSRSFSQSILKTCHTSGYTSNDVAYAKLSFQLVQNGSIHIKKVKVDGGTIATYWNFNKNDIVYSSLGFNDNIEYDCSGFSYDGTIASITDTTDNGARHNSSYHLSNLDKVTCYNIPFENIKQGTMSFWIKFNTAFTKWSHYAFFASAFNWTGNSADFIIVANNSTGSTAINIDCCSYNYAFTPELNKWYNIVITWDADNYIITKYVNGSLLMSHNDSTNKRLDTYRSKHGYHSLGNATGNASYSGDFNISDFRIYATALSAEDIAEMYNTPASLDKQGNLFAYDFIEEDA